MALRKLGDGSAINSNSQDFSSGSSNAPSLRLIFPPTVQLIGRREEVSVQQTLGAVGKQLKLMTERGLYRDIDMSCHVGQGTRAGECLRDEGVRAGNRRTER